MITYSMNMKDKEKFINAKEMASLGGAEKMGIGTFKEGTLHRVMKYYIEPDESLHEIKTGSFIADIKRGDQIVEVQTRGFSKLRKKLDYFLEDYKVTIVYPIAYTKWLSWINIETGEVSPKRKSPKKGSAYEMLFELYKIKSFLRHPNLSLLIILINVEEYKLLNGWSHDKKRGAYRTDRVPIEFIDRIDLKSEIDYVKLIPSTLEPTFTAKDYKMHTKLSLKSAQTALNVLTYVEAVERIGKKGRAYLYKVSVNS